MAQQESEGKNGPCIFKKETTLAGAAFVSSSRETESRIEGWGSTRAVILKLECASEAC